MFGKFVEQKPRWVLLKASGEFFLSPRERAGVRGKVTFAVRTALTLPPKSVDRPKGRSFMPPALPEDSQSSIISGMVSIAVSNGNPIPLTLPLSLGERE